MGREGANLCFRVFTPVGKWRMDYKQRDHRKLFFPVLVRNDEELYQENGRKLADSICVKEVMSILINW